MDINLEGLPAAIERKCGEVLATANRIDEINRRLMAGVNGKTAESGYETEEMEIEYVARQDEFHMAMFALLEMLGAFGTQASGLAFNGKPVPEI